MKFLAEIAGGALRPLDAGAWRLALAQAKPGRVVVTIEREKRGRSLEANAYYWGVVLALLSEWSGHEAEELHEYFKDKFLARPPESLPNGAALELKPSTALLDSKAFAEYVDRVRRFAAENGLYVPGPNEPAEVTL